MKSLKHLMMAAALLLVATFSYAQIPQGFSYQSVLRDNVGNILANSGSLSVRFKIMDGTDSVYIETHTDSTNQFGLLTLTVGQGTPVTGTFNTIDWNTGSYSLKVEIDYGSGYEHMGTNPMLTVPFAMTAGSAPGIGPWTSVTDGIEYTNGMVHINNSSVNYPLLVQSGFGGTVWMPKLQNKIISGSDQGGAIYFGATDNNGTNPTAAIEASWGANGATPTLGIGAVRDGFGGRIVMYHTGHIALINSGVERLVVSNVGTVHAYANLIVSGSVGSIAVEVRSDGGTPYIDFSNDNSVDNDARFLLENDDLLRLEGADLAVLGKIGCTEVTVSVSGFPDYVFKDDYDLMPLNELATFIEDNGHLPNMPKEADVIENGIGLAEMNVKLVEKVEELTLHTIEQQQLIETQQESINKQAEALKLLELRIAELAKAKQDN